MTIPAILLLLVVLVAIAFSNSGELRGWLFLVSLLLLLLVIIEVRDESKAAGIEEGARGYAEGTIRIDTLSNGKTVITEVKP